MRKMEPKEPLEVRREMVDMHEGFKKSLSDKIGAEDYIAASWICYAIFEQRINRLMQKHIDQCPHKPFDDRKSPKIMVDMQILMPIYLAKFTTGVKSATN